MLAPSHERDARNLAADTIAVVGSSSAAMASMQTLRSAGTNVRWYCRDLDVATTVLLASGPPGRLELSFADPLQADYRDFIAVVAGDGGTLDRAVAARARAQNVPVHVTGQPALSNFEMPAATPWFGTRWRKTRSQEIAA